MNFKPKYLSNPISNYHSIKGSSDLFTGGDNVAESGYCEKLELSLGDLIFGLYGIERDFCNNLTQSKPVKNL